MCQTVETSHCASFDKTKLRSNMLSSLRVFFLGTFFLGLSLSLSFSVFAQSEFCDLDNVLECTQLAAKKLTREHPQTFSLKQDKLQLRFKDKTQELILLSESSMEQHPDDQLTYPIQYWPERHWLLVKQFADGGETQFFAIVDLAKEFTVMELNGTPIFSPDGKKILAYGADIYAGFSANGIAVYDIDKDNLLKKVMTIDDSWGVVAATWRSDKEIQLSTIELCEDDPAQNENGECVKEKRLEFINHQWQLIH